MGLTYSSYYGLARVNNSGPEIKNWAATDSNVQTISLLLKAQEMHVHNGATPMRYPGYQQVNPATPATPLLTLSTTGGSIGAGITVGTRLSFTNNIGLETEASPETTLMTPAIVTRPSAMVTSGPLATPVPGAVSGGTYIYAITKRLGTGESETSDVTTVSVPFDSTGLNSYTVPFTFTPISAYTDGTDSLCIYRSTGFDNSFVLLSYITATPGLQNNVSSYIDNNTITDPNHQPPSSSQFAKQNAVTIDWSNISIPSNAVFFNVYVTQQAGVYGVNSLLQKYNLQNPATPLPPNYMYQGTEVLGLGYPQEFTQLPYGAAPIYLTTQAYGAPQYTEPANASGWPTYNFVLPSQGQSTPMFGAMYVDSSVGQLKVALSTPGGVGAFTTLAGVGSGYAHPTVESGGHSASHIQVAPEVGGPTQDQLNSLFSTPVAGGPSQYRKPATTIYQVAATPMTMQNSNSGGTFYMVPDLDTSIQWPNGVSPVFAGQNFEINFSATTSLFFGSGQIQQFVAFMLFINGNNVNDTFRNVGAAITPGSISALNQNISFSYTTPLTRSNNRFQIGWALSDPGYVTLPGSNASGVPPYRNFRIREIW